MSNITLPPHLKLLADKINENINSKEIREMLGYTVEEITCDEIFDMQKNREIL